MATIDRRGVSVDATDTPIAGDPNPGLAIKAPCLVATTANIVLSGLQTVDGVALAAGNRVLVKNQTDATTNGIYEVSTGGWTRSIDFSSNDQIAAGVSIAVTAGATFARQNFQLTSADPVTLGSSALSFATASGLVPASRRVNTTAPLAGGAALSADVTLSLNPNGITYTLFQQVAAASIVGNPTGAPANAQEITLGATLAFAGSVLRTAALSGDISSAANSFLATIAAGAVSNAKMAAMAAWSLKGNATGGSAAPTDVTIDGLTLKASPAPADEVLIWDVAGAAMKKSTVSGVGSSAGVASIAGNSGAFTLSTGVKNVVNDIQADPSFFPGYLSGLVLSNDGGTPNSILDIAAGCCVDSTNAFFIKLAGFTKSTAGAWAAGSGGNGMGTGLTIASSTWYHAFAIINSGAADVYFDTSVTAANKPASTTAFRRLGSFKTDGAGHIVAFTQIGDYFWWTVPVRDVNTQNIGTTATNFTLGSVPSGVVLHALVVCWAFRAGAASTAWFYPLFMSDQTVSYGAFGNVIEADASGNGAAATLVIPTNSSAQIRARGNFAGVTVDVDTSGWIDARGK